MTATTSTRAAAACDVCRQVHATFHDLSLVRYVSKNSVSFLYGTSHVFTCVERKVFVVRDRHGFLAVRVMAHPLSFVHLAESVIS